MPPVTTFTATSGQACERGRAALAPLLDSPHVGGMEAPHTSAGAHADMTGSGRQRGAGVPPQGFGDRPRLALPGDLAGSLRYLEDDQLDALLHAVNAEAERRGWKVPRADPRGPRRDATGPAPRASARKRTESRPLPCR